MRRMYDENQIKQIAASGNLYVHTVFMTNAGNHLKAFANIYSTDLTPITSFDILKSYLGEQFDYPVNGYEDSLSQVVWRMTNPGGLYPGDDTAIPWSGVTFTDTIAKL